MLVEETGNERRQTSKIKTTMHNPFSFLVHKLRRNKLMQRHSIEKGYHSHSKKTRMLWNELTRRTLHSC